MVKKYMKRLIQLMHVLTKEEKSQKYIFKQTL